MTVSPNEQPYVLFLAGERVSAGSITVVDGALGIWCRDPVEIEDRARRLRPCCLILDGSGQRDLEDLVRSARRAAGDLALVAVIGAVDPSAVDCAIAPDGNVSGEVTRIIRFALGKSVRSHARICYPGQARVEYPGGRHTDVDIVDLSEDSIRASGPLAMSDEPEVRLRIFLPDEREMVVQAIEVRRAGGEKELAVVYRFVDLPARARSALRVLVMRRAVRNGSRLEAAELPVRSASPRSQARPITIIGTSSAIQRSLETLARVAPTGVTVLLLGETGTGKELAARGLHSGSPRADRPFVPVNCAALPENLVESELFGHEPGAFTGATKRKIGRIEQASGGTLFLDEIGDLPAPAQAKLLRALQERVIERVGGTEMIRVDIRLIAATNQNLETGMARRSFRRDLFFRLNVVAVTLPPLRERGEDIPLLADHFLRQAMEKLGKRDIRLNDHAQDTLLRYPWPGNVRELENLCTRLVALASSGATLGPEHLNLLIVEELADCPLASTDLRDILDFCEREIVKRMLDRHGGNRTKTARALGVSRQALQQKLARFRNGGAGTNGQADPGEPD